ncbi:hypothetical protein CP973_39165 [Streptomyces albofaciens JCM 4342]|uniref:ATP-binding protein n=1 Tax=Streptomyces albofaciens TaxID=66866 RepID=UPI00123B69B5|nr:ATP-binding protein [Streptomyces albofaciens]KAA6215027.1 hypothetical protein CP973_39165 [Streptomyces albofaciens JCM 4342]
MGRPRGDPAIANALGTGGKPLRRALAHKALDRGLRIAWCSLASLTAHVGRAGVDNSAAKAIAKIIRCHLIVLDDIGMLPSGQAAAQAFYESAPVGLRLDRAQDARHAAVDRLLHQRTSS